MAWTLTPLRRRVLLATAVLLVGTLAALQVVLRSGAVRERVRARAEEVLEARLGGEAHLGDTYRVSLTGGVTLGPLEVPARTAGAPPVLRVERITARPSLRALLSGRVEPGRVVLGGVQVEAGPQAGELRALVQRIRARPARRPRTPAPDAEAERPLPTVVLEDARLALELGGARREVGPLDARLVAVREGGGARAELRLALDAGGKARARLERGEDGAATLALTFEDVALGALARGLAAPAEVERGAWSGELHAQLSPRTDATLRLRTRLQDVTLRHARLADAPVGPVTLEVTAEGAWAAGARRAELRAFRLALGALAVSATGTVQVGGDVRASARLEPVSFQEALAALPPALRPELEEVAALDGRFGAQVDVAGPLRNTRAWEVKGKLDLAELKRAARGSPPFRLDAPFDYVPLAEQQEGARGRKVHVGPRNPAFTPLAEVPEVLVRAVLLSEDSFFYQHRGFDFDALVGNLLPSDDGRLRGGSTLTQQLAKNLFLSRERTYARKVREAFLTLALEASVPKARLLEVYLNAIEWGPGLYGIGEAARHYFAKAPAELSVKEAVFLATIIPNPVRYHGYCRRGAVTEVWAQRMEDLLVKLHAAGDLTDAQLEEARLEVLTFHHEDAAARGGRRPPG